MKGLSAAILLAAVLVAGCTDRRFIQVRDGVGVSAKDVRAYAKEHHMTYEQALAALRHESDEYWAQEEAKHQRQAGLPAATAAKPKQDRVADLKVE